MSTIKPSDPSIPPQAIGGTRLRVLNYLLNCIPPSVRKDNHRFYQVLAFIIVLSLAGHASFIPIFALLDAPSLVLYNCFSVALFLGTFFLNRRGYHYTAIPLMVVEYVGHAALCVHLVGWPFGFQVYVIGWSFIPFLAPKGHRLLKNGIFVVSCATAILLYEYSRVHPVVQRWSPAWEHGLYAFNWIFHASVLAFAFHYFRDTADFAYEQSERLLRNVFPEKVADRLKTGDNASTERFEETTVLFLDIVNFTPLADSLPPDRVVQILNVIFTRLDEIAGRWELEKIKTIGDAYMVAGGLPEPQSDHARRIGLFALDAMREVSALNVGLSAPIALRIGIHTGPSVAGVIGQRRFCYDLWGDTVNLAARMESHGVPGKIQVSNQYQTLMNDQFDFEARGHIEVKGKGMVQAYFLVGANCVHSHPTLKPLAHAKPVDGVLHDLQHQHHS